jgi:hypothetical protein
MLHLESLEHYDGRYPAKAHAEAEDSQSWQFHGTIHSVALQEMDRAAYCANIPAKVASVARFIAKRPQATSEPPSACPSFLAKSSSWEYMATQYQNNCDDQDPCCRGDCSLAPTLRPVMDPAEPEHVAQKTDHKQVCENELHGYDTV